MPSLLVQLDARPPGTGIRFTKITARASAPRSLAAATTATTPRPRWVRVGTTGPRPRPAARRLRASPGRRPRAANNAQRPPTRRRCGRALGRQPVGHADLDRPAARRRTTGTGGDGRRGSRRTRDRAARDGVRRRLLQPRGLLPRRQALRAAWPTSNVIVSGRLVTVDSVSWSSDAGALPAPPGARSRRPSTCRRSRRARRPALRRRVRLPPLRPPAGGNARTGGNAHACPDRHGDPVKTCHELPARPLARPRAKRLWPVAVVLARRPRRRADRPVEAGNESSAPAPVATAAAAQAAKGLKQLAKVKLGEDAARATARRSAPSTRVTRSRRRRRSRSRRWRGPGRPPRLRGPVGDHSRRRRPVATPA